MALSLRGASAPTDGCPHVPFSRGPLLTRPRPCGTAPNAETLPAPGSRGGDPPRGELHSGIGGVSLLPTQPEPPVARGGGRAGVSVSSASAAVSFLAVIPAVSFAGGGSGMLCSLRRSRACAGGGARVVGWLPPSNLQIAHVGSSAGHPAGPGEGEAADPGDRVLPVPHSFSPPWDTAGVQLAPTFVPLCHGVSGAPAESPPDGGACSAVNVPFPSSRRQRSGAKVSAGPRSPQSGGAVPTLPLSSGRLAGISGAAGVQRHH